jgi:hypothetical protein
MLYRTQNLMNCTEFYLSGCSAVQSVESQSKFRRNMSPPSSGLESLFACFMLVSCLTCSSSVKMEMMIYSSETSVYYKHDKRCLVIENRILCNHRHENFKSNLMESYEYGGVSSSSIEDGEFF